MENRILATLGRKNYVLVKPRTLGRQAGVPAAADGEFRRVLQDLAKKGKVTFGRNHAVRPATIEAGTIAGTFRKTGSGRGFVRPPAGGPEIAISDRGALDATTGDTVTVRVVRKAAGDRPAIGE